MQVGAKRAKKNCTQRARFPTELPFLHATVGGWESACCVCVCDRKRKRERERERRKKISLLFLPACRSAERNKSNFRGREEPLKAPAWWLLLRIGRWWWWRWCHSTRGGESEECSKKRERERERLGNLKHTGKKWCCWTAEQNVFLRGHALGKSVFNGDGGGGKGGGRGEEHLHEGYALQEDKRKLFLGGGGVSEDNLTFFVLPLILSPLTSILFPFSPSCWK